MCEIRLAGKGEITQQKEIWKLCFRDSRQYINFFYANMYSEDQTMLLLEAGKILAMLTMLPLKLVTSQNQSFDIVMLYAVATHPKYQNKGHAGRLMDFTHHYLKENNYIFSVLVPANEHLFDFYGKQGYQVGFFNREFIFTRRQMENLAVGDSSKCMLRDITPKEYNLRRKNRLNGKLYISYSDQDIAYQKRLSQRLNGDIFGIDFAHVHGCAAVEKINPDKIFIKEILVPDNYFTAALREILKLMPAEEYVIRTPLYLGDQQGGIIRPFGMIKATGTVDFEISQRDYGFLGLAFD